MRIARLDIHAYDLRYAHGAVVRIETDTGLTGWGASMVLDGHQPRSRDGRGTAPAGPGLGVEVDPDALGAPVLTVAI